MLMLRVRYGVPLVQLDPKEESRIRLKMDFALVPLVSLLYRMFYRSMSQHGHHSINNITVLAFIDRSNIGKSQY